MSDIAHTTIPLRLRMRSSRAVLIAATVFLVLGAMIVVLTVSTGSESTDINRAVSPVTRTGGPNEAARGQAAASSAGARVSQTGGPNEGTRGRVAAAASRP